MYQRHCYIFLLLCLFSDTFIRLFIGPTKELNDQQQEIVNEMIACQVQVFMRYHNISTSEGVGALIKHITTSYKMALVSVNMGSLKVVLCCRNLESLEHLWGDYLSGHLNEVAEKCLVTDKIKSELKLETIRLKTTIEEENYFMCRKALMEMSGEFLARFSFEFFN